MNGFLALIVCFAAIRLQAQDQSAQAFPRKGSYLYFGQPAFEDNSFLLEEAINQEKGVNQFIANVYLDNLRGGSSLFNFTHEIPLGGERHQLSYTIFYYMRGANVYNTSGGLGDINLSYHWMASGKRAWAMVVPSITAVIPTGKNGFGSGGLGAQLGLAVTKRISHKIVTHYNFGYTFISQADEYVSTITGSQVVGFERDLQYKNIGASVIWYPKRKFNFMLEYVSNFLSDIQTDGSITQRHQLTVNPGLRFAIDYNRMQIVPGISAPNIFVNGNYSRTGLFFYLSFEPQYLPFYKEKSR